MTLGGNIQADSRERIRFVTLWIDRVRRRSRQSSGLTATSRGYRTISPHIPKSYYSERYPGRSIQAERAIHSSVRHMSISTNHLRHAGCVFVCGQDYQTFELAPRTECENESM